MTDQINAEEFSRIADNLLVPHSLKKQVAYVLRAMGAEAAGVDYMGELVVGPDPNDRRLYNSMQWLSTWTVGASTVLQMARAWPGIVHVLNACSNRPEKLDPAAVDKAVKRVLARSKKAPPGWRLPPNISTVREDADAALNYCLLGGMLEKAISEYSQFDKQMRLASMYGAGSGAIDSMVHAMYMGHNKER
jgi:hypothetical protein